MLPKIKFDTIIEKISLKFLINALENTLKKVNDKVVLEWGMHKFFIIISSIIVTAGMLYLALGHYMQKQMNEFWAAIIVTIVADIGIIVELVIHHYNFLRGFRSIALTISCHFASVYYACSKLPVPGFLPGYMSSIILLEVSLY